jgi:hypothetical protein
LKRHVCKDAIKSLAGSRGVFGCCSFIPVTWFTGQRAERSSSERLTGVKGMSAAFLQPKRERRLFPSACHPPRVSAVCGPCRGEGLRTGFTRPYGRRGRPARFPSSSSQGRGSLGMERQRRVQATPPLGTPLPSSPCFLWTLRPGLFLYPYPGASLCSSTKS